jgi:hypothetical protein
MINLDNLKHFIYHLGNEKPATIIPRNATAWRNYQNITTTNPDFVWAPLNIFKDQFGFVHIGGLIRDGVYGGTDTSTLIYLEPSKTVIRRYTMPAFVGGSPDQYGRVDVVPNIGDQGGVQANSAMGATGTWLAPSGYWPTAMRGWESLDSLYQNGTADYQAQNTPSNTLYQGGMFWKDPFGFVHIKGMVKTFPNNTSGSPAFTMPVGYRPAMSEIFPTIGSGTFGQIRINNSGQVFLWTNNTNEWITLHLKYMASDSPLADDWNDMDLLNSWVIHGGEWQTPQWIMTPDGILHLRGLIKDGTTTAGTDIWEIPSNIRVSSHGQIFPAACGGNKMAGLDFRSDLRVVELRNIGTGGSNGYLTLNNVYYRTDWF